MVKGDIRSRLNLMIACGHPVFIFGDTVVLPVEAEDFFEPKEMEDLQAYILSNR